MSDGPWVTIIGLGEDGPDGLSPASREALQSADVVMGPPRHLSLLADVSARQVEWPVPFADGTPLLLSMRGQRVAVLASGDPFWFGAGATLSRHLGPNEWAAFPGPSTFSLAANRLGWSLEHTLCRGLHAAPLERLRPDLAPGRRMIVLLRDGDAVDGLATYLTDMGFGDSALTVMEALGGPRERIIEARAEALSGNFAHPVCVGIDIAGEGRAMPLSGGRADDWFDHDGQITKRPVRALTLSALAPRPYEHLWDIGGGSGSIAIEWLLSDPTVTATTVEQHSERADRIRANAARLGVDRLKVVLGDAPAALDGLSKPDVIFVGGGLNRTMLDALGECAKGARVVANAVTLETEAVLIDAQARLGGDLMRVELAQATPIGTRTGWKAAYPIVQWSAVL